MSDQLKELLLKARHIEMTPEDREEQRRSFAYGNANIENARVTREIVNQEADKLVAQKAEAK